MFFIGMDALYFLNIFCLVFLSHEFVSFIIFSCLVKIRRKSVVYNC